MESSTCNFVFALVAVLLIVHCSEARDLPSAGILDEMPKNCSGLDFCHVKHEKYPQELIDELLTNKYSLKLGSPHEDTAKRIGTVDGSELCEKDITFGEIYEIIDKNSNVRVVVQSEKHFKQQLRIERCQSSVPRVFRGISSTELENNEFECVETRLDYGFMVLTRDGKGVEYIKTRSGVPVCCSCKLKDDY